MDESKLKYRMVRLLKIIFITLLFLTVGEGLYYLYISNANKIQLGASTPQCQACAGGFNILTDSNYMRFMSWFMDTYLSDPMTENLLTSERRGIVKKIQTNVNTNGSGQYVLTIDSNGKTFNYALDFPFRPKIFVFRSETHFASRSATLVDMKEGAAIKIVETSTFPKKGFIPTDIKVDNTNVFYSNEKNKDLL